MGERLFRANGLHHDEKSFCETTLVTQIEQQLEANRLASLTRSTTKDKSGKRFQENTSRNDQDKNSTTRRPPNRRAPVRSTEEQRCVAAKMCSNGQNIIRAVSWDEQDKLPAQSREQGSNEIPTCNRKWLASNLQTIMEEDEGQGPTTRIPSSRTARDNLKSELEKGGDTLTGRTHKRYKQIKIDTFFNRTHSNVKMVYNDSTPKEEIDTKLGKFFANEFAIIEMITRGERRESSLTEYLSSDVEVTNQIDIPSSWETTMLHITCGMHECNNRLGYKQIGKAMRMIALLRRCLYPKRDVIRWQSAGNGEHLSLEDVSTQ